MRRCPLIVPGIPCVHRHVLRQSQHVFVDHKVRCRGRVPCTFPLDSWLTLSPPPRRVCVCTTSLSYSLCLVFEVEYCVESTTHTPLKKITHTTLRPTPPGCSGCPSVPLAGPTNHLAGLCTVCQSLSVDSACVVLCIPTEYTQLSACLRLFLWQTVVAVRFEDVGCLRTM